MPDFEYTRDGPIALMRFNRPEKLNAITYEMLGAIDDAVHRADSDPEVRAIVLTGEGRAFSAGTDLQQLSTQGPPATNRVQDAAQRASDRQPAPWTFASTAKPTIAAVNGAAVGLGVELTSQCDFRIASESARFGWVFIHRGLITDTGAGTWLLARIVGLQNAAYLLYSGEIIDAHRARELGYVMEVTSDAELLDRSLAFARSVSRGSPLAIAETKRLLYQSFPRDAADHVHANAAALQRMFESDDFKEGVRAFLEKRDPAWPVR